MQIKLLPIDHPLIQALPDGLLDHVNWKTVAMIARFDHRTPIACAFS